MMQARVRVGMRAGVLAMFFLLLPGCATPPSLASRQAAAQQLAAPQGWTLRRVPAGEFDIASFSPVNAPRADELWVYIEGDGLAYVSSQQVSDDPTPIDALGLQLALAQPSGRAVYLARPCQFGLQPACRRAYWSERRFSEEVVRAMDAALTQVKAQAGAKRLTLVGYSGGGAIAALLAERRSDVTRLVTVAGNLWTTQWAAQLGLSPLKGSLDPYLERGTLAGIDQWHFVGDADNVVPKSLAHDFAAGQPRARVVEEQGYDHHCCWSANWASIWATIQK